MKYKDDTSKDRRSGSKKKFIQKLCPICPAEVTRLAAVIAAALLFGGLFLLFRDDVDVMIQSKKIKPYVPDISVLDMPEITAVHDESAVKIKDESKDKLTEQVQDLREQFDGSVGWIYVPDTSINYPVMYSGDNEYYLHRGVDGGYLRAGSVFLDGRCSPDLTGQINILYGHRMSDGSMFADITKYYDENYFNSHMTGWLTTDESVYRIDLFSIVQADISDEIYDISLQKSIWLKTLRERSYIWKNTDITESDKLISFLTCTDPNGTSRTLLTGKLIKM